MSLPVPLVVRVGDQHITRELSDLSFRSSVPGGFASATLTLSRPLAQQPFDLDPFSRVVIQSAQSAETVWEGRLEDPGRSAGSGGEVWQLAAMGPAAYARDRAAPYICVDRNLQPWYVDQSAGGRVKAGQTTLTEYANDATVEGMELVFPGGSRLTTNGVHRMRYSLLRECGQLAARLDYVHIEGRTHAELFITLAARAPGGPQVALRSETFSTGESTSSPVRFGIDTGFDADMDIVEIQIKWTGLNNQLIDDDITWASIAGLYVMAQRYGKDGSVVAGSGYTSHTVLASEVAVDVGVRFLSDVFDMAGASVTASTAAIDQFAYWDGATPGELFDALLEFEPAFYWAAWERNPSNDRYGFQFISWPVVVRYEAGVEDGYDAPGSAADLYNRVVVRWRDERGRVHHVIRTQAVPELDDAGLTRSYPLDLSDQRGSAANAISAGDAFLADHATVRLGGSLTVARPIVDHQLGRMIQPWEIRPGYLIRIRGVQPRPSTLSATGRDGLSVARVVATEFNADSGSVTLELDTPLRSVAKQMAANRAPKVLAGKR